MTSIDLTDSLSDLSDSEDFNGLIMADALWEMPGVPEYDEFVTNWEQLNTTEWVLFQLLDTNPVDHFFLHW